jgi:hypothetical protein
LRAEQAQADGRVADEHRDLRDGGQAALVGDREGDLVDALVHIGVLHIRVGRVRRAVAEVPVEADRVPVGVEAAGAGEAHRQRRGAESRLQRRDGHRRGVPERVAQAVDEAGGGLEHVEVAADRVALDVAHALQAAGEVTDRDQVAAGVELGGADPLPQPVGEEQSPVNSSG